MERHAVPPDGRSPLDDDQGPAGDLRRGRQRLGGGDGGGDADGVEDGAFIIPLSMVAQELSSLADRPGPADGG